MIIVIEFGFRTYWSLNGNNAQLLCHHTSYISYITRHFMCFWSLSLSLCLRLSLAVVFMHEGNWICQQEYSVTMYYLYCTEIHTLVCGSKFCICVCRIMRWGNRNAIQCVRIQLNSHIWNCQNHGFIKNIRTNYKTVSRIISMAWRIIAKNLSSNSLFVFILLILCCCCCFLWITIIHSIIIYSFDSVSLYWIFSPTIQLIELNWLKIGAYVFIRIYHCYTSANAPFKSKFD